MPRQSNHIAGVTRRILGTTWWYIRSIVKKMADDDLLFLASGIAFNGILTMIPLFLLGASALGVLLNSSELAVARLNDILNALFPPQPFAISIKESILTIIGDIIVHRTSLGMFGILVLLYTATSLFDAVRSALHKVYKVSRTRGVLASFIRHQGFLALVFLLFIASSMTLWVVTTLESLVLHVPAFSSLTPPEEFHTVIPTLVTFVLTAFMFYILYRYIPDTTPPRDAAMISTVTTTVLWVVSSKLFAVYLSSFSSLGTIYGPYAFILVLLIWVYYSSLMFVIGAVVGQVHWERSRLKTRLTGDAALTNP